MPIEPWGVNPSFRINPAIEAQLLDYGKKYLKQLTKQQQEKLDEIILKHDGERYSNGINDNTIKTMKKMGTNTIMKKAFLFTQYNKISIASDKQEEAFAILHKEELETYYKQFTMRWKTEAEATPSLIASFPYALIGLILNEDARFKHFKTFINHPQISFEGKNIIIKLIARTIQNQQKRFLTKKQVKFLLTLKSTAKQNLNYAPIITSIRHHNKELEELPDSWLIEIMNSAYLDDNNL